MATLNGLPAAAKATPEGVQLTVRDGGEWVSTVVGWDSMRDAIESGAADFVAV